MSRLLKITDLGSGIMVQGTDNVLYPDNATLTYPYNSIVVVTDESDIATFRSASNNDVLFSGLIGKIEIGGETVTKQNINTKFDAIANQESGGGGGGDVSGLFADASYDSQTKHINFYDKDNTLVVYVDATDFIKDGMVSNVEILNGNLVITFNTDAGKEPITIPLTDIFNPNNYYTKSQIDAKEEVINSALTEVRQDVDKKADVCYVDFMGLYNKETEITVELWNEWHEAKENGAVFYTSDTPVDDGLRSEPLVVLSGPEGEFIRFYMYNDYGWKSAEIWQTGETEFQVTTTNEWTYEVDEQLDSESTNPVQNAVITPALAAKANASEVYTKTESDAKYATQVVVNDEIAARIEAIRDVNTTLEGKADKSDTYTKTQVDTALAAKVSQTEFDTKEEVISTALNELEENKQDKLTAGQNITIQNNVISSTGGTQQQADWNQSDSTAVDYIKNKPTIPDTSDFVSINQYNPKELAIAEALTDLNENKADKTDIPNLNNYYTKTETDTAISSAIGQIDLSDYQTKADADVKEEVISTALNNLAANKVNNLGGVANIVKISAADYAALTTKDNNTLYIITTN